MARCDPQSLWDSGYSATDIVATFFRMCKVFEMAEYLKLEFMRVRTRAPPDAVTPALARVPGVIPGGYKYTRDEVW